MTRRVSITIPGFDHGPAPVPVACRIDNIVHTGAISGYDKALGRHADGVEAQTVLMFVHLRAILEAAGADAGDVVRMTFYVRSNDARPAINAQWVSMFPDAASRPARQIQTYDTPKDALIQCDAVAVLPR